LIVLTAPATRALEIHAVHVTDQNNVTNEQWEIEIIRATTAGVGAATAIPKVPLEVASGASTAVCEHTYITTQPVLAADPLDLQSPPSLSGYHFEPAPDDRPIVPPSGIISIRQNKTIASTTLNAEVIWREIG